LNTFTRKRTEEEIRELQEKKNYQDFVYQTNQALQDLKNQIASQNAIIAQLKARSSSDIQNLSIEFENLEQSTKDQVKECQAVAKDLKFSVSSNLELLGRMKRDFEFLFVDYDNYLKQTNIFHFDIIWLKERLNQAFEAIRVSENLLNGKINESERRIKNDCAPDLSHHHQLLSQIEQDKDVSDNNIAGLALEIDRLKKTVNYGEKKFENLYTLINRLNEAKNVASR